MFHQKKQHRLPKNAQDPQRMARPRLREEGRHGSP